MLFVIKKWIPLGVAITGICAFVYLNSQQNLRVSSNDPQIQISEDLALKIESGQDASTLSLPEATDISRSLAPFVIVYNDKNQVLVSSARINGQTPVLPQGVLDYVKKFGQHRLTWMPEPDVRSAVVITPFDGQNPGFVLVGRSLKETEIRQKQLLVRSFVSWIVIIFATLAASFVFSKKTSRI